MLKVPKTEELASKLDDPQDEHEFKPMGRRYWTEAVLAYILYAFFAILPVQVASYLGGKMAEIIGPMLGASHKADRNLRLAFPNWDTAKRKETIKKMWNNLGRVVAEYPHLSKLWERGFVDTQGISYDVSQFQKNAGLFVSGHLGNWELCIGSATTAGIETATIYRAPNNRIVDTLIRKARSRISAWQIRKGHSGAKKLLIALRHQISLAMLVDQKLSTGIPVPFFGHDALTATAAAHFALKMKRPLALARIVRVKGTSFKMELLPPLDLPNTGNFDDDLYQTMLMINQQLEAWITEYPDQWLWLHRRWGKDVYQELALKEAKDSTPSEQ